MITLFRRIRQKLIDSGSITKYLLYAVGEILLVVFGILIALQVNNWNENKKNLEGIKRTIVELESELLKNFYEAGSVLEFWTMQDSISKQVIFDDLTIDDYSNDDLISIVAVNWLNYTPEVENFNLLLENEKFANKRLNPIFASAKNLQLRIKNLEEQWSVLRRNLEANLRTITGEVSLVKLDGTSTGQKFQYLLNNESYKRLVELNWIHYEVYYDFISRYRAQAIALLSTIKMVQDNYGQEELEALYASIGMNPFEASSCQHTTFEKNDEIRRGYLIGNLSGDVVTLNVINDGKTGGKYTLLPNQFRHTRPEYAGLNGDYTVIAVQTDINGSCEDKFVAVNKGYLIIN